MNLSEKLFFNVDYFHLGYYQETTTLDHDASNVVDTKELNDSFTKNEIDLLLSTFGQWFLMVGVMDPHKGHRQIIEAFDCLWHNGHDVRLLIIGKPGALEPNLPQLIINHREYGQKLLWKPFVSDIVLTWAYQNALALIAGSYSEGFCLPLIEAAHHNLPIVARNIPIFREVVGNSAFYFDSGDVQYIADDILCWIGLYRKNNHPDVSDVKALTWMESTQQLLSAIQRIQNEPVAIGRRFT